MTEASLRKTNAVILTTQTLEYQAVRHHLNTLKEEIHYGGTIYEKGIFLSEQGSLTVVIAEVGRSGIDVAIETERAIGSYKPEFVLCVGIANGITGVNVGDVVVASKIYHYDPAKEGQITLTMPDIGNTSYSAQQRARAEARKPDWLKRLSAPPPYPYPQVMLAPIAAGSKILSSTYSHVYTLLRTHFHDAVAVELQGFGFLQAVYANQSRANQFTESLVVRGISSLVDDQQEVGSVFSQTLAAERASAFAFQILAGLQFKTTNQHLEQGAKMLLVGDYQFARQELRQAINSINVEYSSEEAAQARYLSALAILGRDLPRVKGREAMQTVEKLLSTAINLRTTSFYRWALALIQEDHFAYNGLRHRLGEVSQLEQQATHTQWNRIDGENLKYFEYCQPELFRRFALKTGRSF